MTDLHVLRERFGIGFFQIRKARKIADERFDGDIRLGVAWTEADAFAINVKGGREARDEWNDAWARKAVDDGRFA